MEICVVSHSEQIAAGIKALVSQMAEGLTIKAVGGIDGEIGTSIDAVTAMLDEVEGEAIVFYDIGSSKMNIEMALEMNDYSQITIAHFPLVEGAFLAGVEMMLGKNKDDILESLKNNFKEKE